MRHVICRLPNASENISGVDFVRQDDGSVMTAEPMDDADAETMFGSIPGYELVDPDAPAATAEVADGGNKRTRMSAAEKAAKAAAEASGAPPTPVVEPAAAPAPEDAPVVPAEAPAPAAPDAPAS